MTILLLVKSPEIRVLLSYAVGLFLLFMTPPLWAQIRIITEAGRVMLGRSLRLRRDDLSPWALANHHPWPWILLSDLLPTAGMSMAAVAYLHSKTPEPAFPEDLNHLRRQYEIPIMSGLPFWGSGKKG